MMGPGETLAVLITIIVPVVFLAYLARRWFALKEKQVDANSVLAAEKAAQYAARTNELEQRVRVLEKLATDGGVETAAQIEALRDRARIGDGDKVQ